MILGENPFLFVFYFVFMVQDLMLRLSWLGLFGLAEGIKEKECSLNETCRQKMELRRDHEFWENLGSQELDEIGLIVSAKSSSLSPEFYRCGSFQLCAIKNYCS